MRLTSKLVRGCMVIAAKYGQSLASMLQNETSARLVYAELKADNYAWNITTQTWERRAENVPNEPQSEVVRLPAEIRIICEDKSAADVASSYLCDVLEQAGARVNHVSLVKDNFDGKGARVYLKVEL